eukprot:SAG31_NODE_35450_length_323_cov_0.687500_1_plen_73_part_10
MGQCLPSKEAARADDKDDSTVYSNPVAQLEDNLELIDACGSGDANAVSKLLSRGANPDVVDPETNGTALMVAA